MSSIGRTVVLSAICFALAGCCSYGPYGRLNSASSATVMRQTVSWDGRFLQPARRGTVSRAVTQSIAVPPVDNEDAELARHKKYSADWWAVKNEFDRKDDARLAKVLTICRGCLAATFASSQAEQTGALPTAR
jgi:hypothetical protein